MKKYTIFLQTEKNLKTAKKDFMEMQSENLISYSMICNNLFMSYLNF